MTPLWGTAGRQICHLPRGLMDREAIDRCSALQPFGGRTRAPSPLHLDGQPTAVQLRRFANRGKPAPHPFHQGLKTHQRPGPQDQSLPICSREQPLVSPRTSGHRRTRQRDRPRPPHGSQALDAAKPHGSSRSYQRIEPACSATYACFFPDASLFQELCWWTRIDAPDSLREPRDVACISRLRSQLSTAATGPRNGLAT